MDFINIIIPKNNVNFHNCENLKFNTCKGDVNGSEKLISVKIMPISFAELCNFRLYNQSAKFSADVIMKWKTSYYKWL
jgi:hypothetical protein